MRNELVSSGLDFSKMGYRLSFYIKMSVLLTGASWRADQIVPRTFQPAATAHWRLNTTRSRPRRLRGQIMEKGPPDFSKRVTDDSGAFACICCIYHKMWEPTWRKLAGVRPPNSHRLHATESLGSTVLAQFNMFELETMWNWNVLAKGN